MQKKQLFILLTLFYSSILFGQSNTQPSAASLTNYDKDSFVKYIIGSNTQGCTIKFDENNDLVLTKIIDNLKHKKDELYNKAFGFFVYTYKDAKSVIQQQDKDAGIIIGKGYYSDFHCSNIKYKMMGTNVEIRDFYSAYHILRIDIKDNRARIMLSISNYDVKRMITASNWAASSTSDNTPIVSKKIINCSPIDTTSVDNRVEKQIGSKKTSKLVRKYMVEDELRTIESEKQSFLPLYNSALSTIMKLEKVLTEGNATNENW